ncbi:MAG: LacI family transcriptional regulator [Spirochaetaceae bacterium]|jgi:LacI family transcriptional regulator|nr:LacI family transcriptional regulator [Spirochaetaceae bacterium]
MARTRRTPKQPTVKEVAALAGVSLATVSHVINKTRYVSEETIAKVENAIKILDYKANPIARNLSSGESRLIGYVVSNIECYFYLDMATGIEKTINEEGYQLLLMDSKDSKQREMLNIETLIRRGVDGIIIAPTTTEYGFLNELLPDGFPVVFLDRQPLHYTADYVLLNNTQASFEATSYLIRKGYTRIAYITYHYGENEIDDTTGERITGFKEAHRDAGIPLDNGLIQTVPGASYTRRGLMEGEAYSSMKRMLDKQVQAVICGNGFAAAGVVNCLNETGIHIPQDMALITYDDDLWMSMTRPKLSSIIQPAEAMGSRAAERILKRLRGGGTPFESFRLEAHIVYRGSC